MKENKKVFKVEDKEYAVLRPNHRDQAKAELVKSKAFRESVEAGALVRASVERVMREQKLWDDEKQANFEKFSKSLLEGERKLVKGRIKLSQAREIAVQMRRDRWELRQLNADRNQLDLHTAEAHAEQARFNYFVSVCTVDNENGKPYFKDVEDYLSKDDDPVAGAAATAMGKLLYGLEDDFEAKLPENKFLLQYKFCNPKLHLIDKEGNLIDSQNRRVDDKGRLVNEKGDLIDFEGNLVTEDGDYKADDFQPFENDVEEAVTAA